jgi:hypothetical protein
MLCNSMMNTFVSNAMVKHVVRSSQTSSVVMLISLLVLLAFDFHFFVNILTLTQLF